MKRLKRLITAMAATVLLLGFVSGEPSHATTGTLKGQVEIGGERRDQNTVVYLQGIQGNYEPPLEAAVLDQKDKVFVPHLLPVQSGQTVHFKNTDPVFHNVRLYWGGRNAFNKAQAPGSQADWTAPRPGEYVVLCDLHPEMSAVVLVLDHPFYSDVGASEFTIEHIPAGTYTLVAVRDVRGNLQKKETEVTIQGAQTTDVLIQY